jgi:hypothetical protein
MRAAGGSSLTNAEPRRDHRARFVLPMRTDPNAFGSELSEPLSLFRMARGAASFPRKRSLRLALAAIEHHYVGGGEQFSGGERDRVRNSAIDADMRQVR